MRVRGTVFCHAIEGKKRWPGCLRDTGRRDAACGCLQRIEGFHTSEIPSVCPSPGCPCSSLGGWDRLEPSFPSDEGRSESKKPSVEKITRLRLALDGRLATGALEGFGERQGGAFLCHSDEGILVLCSTSVEGSVERLRCQGTCTATGRASGIMELIPLTTTD